MKFQTLHAISHALALVCVALAVVCAAAFVGVIVQAL